MSGRPSLASTKTLLAPTPPVYDWWCAGASPLRFSAAFAAEAALLA
ncbi:hypothetical protein [Streptomyces prunicolor]|nr:hypothetical protein [Streptomyces prunicolor]